MILFLPAALSLFFSLLFICIPDSAKEIRKAGIFSGLIIFGTALLSCGRGVTLDPVMETFFGWDSFSKLAVILIGFFVMLISVYSAGFLKEKVNRFFSLFFLTAFSAFGIVLSRHWILFTIFWGISGITLYLMMQLEEDAKDAAKKTLVLLGGTDTMLLLAVAVIFNLTGSFAIAESPFHPLAFFFLLSASFAKAGNMPFHTWIPSCAEKAPLPVTAYLPASLDKVLGIYLLMRVFQIFTVPDWARVIVMGLGALTIISAVFMALSQHNGRKLLAYHAVSQVGYMVLGIGTGTVLGMAAGVFHMVNHAIYKSALFLGMGSVEKLRGTDRLEKLGGLARVLPYT
ncbi:MAG TPA: proton-conducting transporter membrane subunit, partial [bacterium]|nr:proton-conducting transporter membrane subunit [bacterium]